MSHVSQDAPGVRSVSIWGSVKEGILFPFKMDKEKARFFFMYMGVVTLCGTVFLMVDTLMKEKGERFIIQGIVFLVALCAYLWASLYTAQRVALGNSTHTSLALLKTRYFLRYVGYFFLYYILYAVCAVIPFLNVAAIYIFARLCVLFPMVATQEEATMSDAWRFGKGYVLEIFCTQVGCCFGVLFSWGLLGGVFHVFDMMADLLLSGELTPRSPIVMLSVSAFVALASWFHMGVYAGVAHLYRVMFHARLADGSLSITGHGDGNDVSHTPQ